MSQPPMAQCRTIKIQNMRKMKHILFLALAAFALAACTQDELAEQPTALPEGEYPLQIGSVSLTAEVSEQPWTRVCENPADGMSSVWQGDERIGVRIGDNEETGIYVVKVDAEGTVMEIIPEKAVYWKDNQPATVTAWYPVDEELNFTHQDKGLTYLLKADEVEASFDKPANLIFSHQFAKVRVKLTGDKAGEVQAVTVRSYEGTNNEQGTPNGRIGTDVYVPMLKADYGGETYWEANLLDGHLEADNTFRLSSDGKNFVQAKLTENVDITPGHVHTIIISVNPAIPEGTPEITDATGSISGTDAYVVRGNDRTTPINITGGSPTIYLDGATVAVGNGNVINITNNATPTIYVVGENNNITSSDGAGIYVEQGSTVTITGRSQDDKLTVRGGNGNSGIGGYIDDTTPANSGNINVSNITLSVYGSYATDRGNISPGIGCSAEATCGTITISSATVHAFGITFTDTGISVPGIGTGFTWVNTYPKNLPDVIVSNSEIHAHRGNPGYTCDYIGWAVQTYYPSTAANSAINPGAGGSIKNSTVYCYTGETLDKTVVYDENGEGKEQ